MVCVLKLKDFSRIDAILASIFGTTDGLIHLFVYCYYGKLATESFEKMANILYKSNWRELPIRLQKHFIVMIANAQQPIHYHGFNVIVLDLTTFCAVRKFPANKKWAFSNGLFLFSVYKSDLHLLHGI